MSETTLCELESVRDVMLVDCKLAVFGDAPCCQTYGCWEVIGNTSVKWDRYVSDIRSHSGATPR